MSASMNSERIRGRGKEFACDGKHSNRLRADAVALPEAFNLFFLRYYCRPTPQPADLQVIFRFAHSDGLSIRHLRFPMQVNFTTILGQQVRKTSRVQRLAGLQVDRKTGSP